MTSLDTVRPDHDTGNITMGLIIDFHTHAFPDQLAKTAVPHLATEGGVEPFLDGRVDSLLSSMDAAGIEKSVVCSIATRPSQFGAILTWSEAIRSRRIIPFPSVHPADPAREEQVRRIKDQGFMGIKMHPYYQDFFLDEARLLPVYEACSALGLILVMHTGYDIAFPDTRRAVPQQIAAVMSRFPELKLVATHLGAWRLWDEVEEHLVGEPVFMDLSFSLDYLDQEQARRLILKHPPHCVLFGSDSPWDGQRRCVEKLRGLALPTDLEERILGGNAQALLDSVSS